MIQVALQALGAGLFMAVLSDDVLLSTYLEDRGWTWLAPGCQELVLELPSVLGLHQSEA